MFTMEKCCANQGGNVFFRLLGAVFGYQDDPTPLEWCASSASPSKA